MNFPIADIELHVSEACFLQGERLFEEGKVGAPFELERQLWLVEVADGRSYEVEIRLSASKVTQAACECELFQKGSECGHFAAALLALRRKWSEQQDKKKVAAAKKERRPGNLSTGIILDNISPQDLADFVRQYAKANRNFAIALKTRFAPSVSVADNKGKFLELLEGAISVSRKADRSLNARGVQKIRAVLDEMLEQMRTALVQQHFTDAVDMAQSIIEKITSLLRKAGERQQELREPIQEAFGILREVVVRQAPPVLLDALWHYLSEESRKLIYRSNSIDLHFLRLMSVMSATDDKTEELLARISEQIGKYLSEGRDPSAVVLLQLQLLEQSGKTLEAQHLVEKYLSAPEVLLFAVRSAAGKEDWKRVELLGNAGLKMQLPPAVVGELEDLLLQWAILENKPEDITRLAQSRFFRSLDIKYYRVFRAVNAENWNGRSDLVLEQLRRMPFSMQRRSAIAAVLAEEGRLEALFDYMKDARSLDLLLQFGAHLLPGMESRLLDLYRELLEQYLRGHVGPKPSQRVREIVEQLYRNGMPHIAAQLVGIIRSEYPERHTLQEEMQIF
jgi:hypothetical protein